MVTFSLCLQGVHSLAGGEKDVAKKFSKCKKCRSKMYKALMSETTLGKVESVTRENLTKLRVPKLITKWLRSRCT